MKQSEFNARFTMLEPNQDFDSPACETVLMLLLRWANQDPVLSSKLPEIPEDAEGKYAKAFYQHRSRCPKCNEGSPLFARDETII